MDVIYEKGNTRDHLECYRRAFHLLDNLAYSEGYFNRRAYLKIKEDQEF